MIPVLATIGAGLTWLVVTVTYLVLWGFCISIGFWAGKHFTNRMDNRIHEKWASKSFRRVRKLFKRDQIAGAATAPA